MSRVIAEIDVSALQHNVAVTKKLAPGCQVMAMVKANSYGHGLDNILLGLNAVDYYGVAAIEAGIALKQAGVQKPIVLMLGPWHDAQFKLICQHQFQFVLHHIDQLNFFIKMPPVGHKLTVWLKVNTGMNRLGLTVEQCVRAYQLLKQHPAVNKVYLMSHLGSADQTDCPQVFEQIAAFKDFSDEIDCLKSLANGAAVIHYPQSHYDIVRPGLLLYGINPTNTPLPAGLSLKPAMTLKSYVVDIHDIQPGQWVGYGATWQADKPSRVATVCIGYGDGYPQFIPSGTPVLVNQQPAQTVGRVSMDTMTIEVSHLKEPVQIGDEVVLWGKNLPIKTIADSAQCSAYALLTGVSPRVKYQTVNVGLIHFTERSSYVL